MRVCNVCNRFLLEMKCIFYTYRYGLFLTCGKGKKKLLGTYVHYITRSCENSSCILYCGLEQLVRGWPWCELVYPVPMLTVDWSCQSLLLVELFKDAFTLFPMGTVWLCCTNLSAWIGFSAAYMYTHCYGVGHHTYTARRATCTYK
jgi:hypothetical protein